MKVTEIGKLLGQKWKEVREEVKKKYINKKKTVIICIDDQYKINKILDELDIPIVLTNESEIYEGQINIIRKNIMNGFIYDKYVVISETEIFHKKNWLYS